MKGQTKYGLYILHHSALKREGKSLQHKAILGDIMLSEMSPSQGQKAHASIYEVLKGVQVLQNRTENGD